MRFLGKIIRIALWSVSTLAAVAVIFTIGLAVRLSSGPVELSVPQSLIDRAVAEAAPGWRVAASGAVIDFSSEDGLNGLKLKDVLLSDPAGTEAISVPALALRFKLQPSLKPTEILTVREVALSGASLDVIRDEQGAFRLALGDLVNFDDTTDGGDPLASLSELGDFGDLPSLRIEEAHVRYSDLARGSTWKTEKARLTLTPSDTGLAASLAVVIDGGIGGAQLDAFHTIESGEVSATLQMHEVRPSRVARLDPVLAPLARVDAPLSGRVELLATNGGKFRRVSGRIVASPGQLTLSGDPIQLHAFAADLACDMEAEGCHLNDLAIQATNINFKARGALNIEGQETAVVALHIDEAAVSDGAMTLGMNHSTLAARINTRTGAALIEQAGLNNVAVSGLPDGMAVSLASAFGSGSYDPETGFLALPSFTADGVSLIDAKGQQQNASQIAAAVTYDTGSQALTLSDLQASGLVLTEEGTQVSLSGARTTGIVDLASNTINLSSVDASGLSVNTDEAEVTLSHLRAGVAYDIARESLSLSGLEAIDLGVSTTKAGIAVDHIAGAATIDLPTQRIFLAPTTLTETRIAQPTAPQSRVASMGINGTVDLLQKVFSDGQAWVRDANVAIPDLYINPVHIGEAQAHFAAVETDGTASIDVQELSATINGLAALANGQLTLRADQTIAGSVNANLGPVPLSEVAHHWPLGVAPGGLRWVAENVSSGISDSVTVSAQFDEAFPDRDTLDLQFGFRDAVASFMPQMPPIQHGQGSGHVTLDRVHIGLVSGTVYSPHAGPLALGNSSFSISDFAPEFPIGDIQVQAGGDIKAVLHLLDTQPLGVISPTGFSIASAKGEADVRVNLSLPLADDVDIDDVRFDARAKVHKYSLIEPDTGLPVEGDLLRVKATPEGMTLDSDARIGGLAARLNYVLGFNKPDPGYPDSTLTVESFLSLNDFARHGLDLDGYLDGLTAMKARIDLFDGGAARIIADADLTNVALKVDRVGWRKDPGHPATIRVSGFRNPNGVGRVEALELRGEGLSADGSIGFDANGKLTRANFSRIVLGSAVDTSVVYGRKTNGDVGILVKGAQLDLRTAFADAIEGRNEPKLPTVHGGPETDIRVEVGRVFLRDELGVFDFKGGIRLRGDNLHAANVTGRLNGSAPAKLLAESRPEGMALRLTSPDAGAFIRATDIFRGAYDGSLQLDAVTRDTVTPTQIGGRILVNDMVVHDAPTLGRILSGGAIGSLMSELKNGGIKFKKIELPFQGIGSRWNIADGVAFGPQIGLTLDGGYDVARGQLALNGSISPAYAINGALGNVPLLGKLLTGGEGEGLFGVTFSVDGHTNEPVVRVNPLSALTPGFLRKIVAEASKGGGSSSPEINPTGSKK